MLSPFENKKPSPTQRVTLARKTSLATALSTYGMPPTANTISHTLIPQKEPNSLTELEDSLSAWNKNVRYRKFQNTLHAMLDTNTNITHTPLPYEIVVLESCVKNVPSLCLLSELDPMLHGKMIKLLHHGYTNITKLCSDIHLTPENTSLRAKWKNIVNTVTTWCKATKASHKISLHSDFTALLLPQSYIPTNIVAPTKQHSANIKDPQFTSLMILIRSFAIRGILHTAEKQPSFDIHTARETIHPSLLITNILVDEFFQTHSPIACAALLDKKMFHPAYVENFEHGPPENRTKIIPPKTLTWYAVAEHEQGDGRIFTTEPLAKAYINGKNVIHKRVLLTSEGVSQAYMWTKYPLAVTPQHEIQYKHLRPITHNTCQACSSILPHDTSYALPPMIVDNTPHTTPPLTTNNFLYEKCLHGICNTCIKPFIDNLASSSLMQQDMTARVHCPGRCKPCKHQSNTTILTLHQHINPKTTTITEQIPTPTTNAISHITPPQTPIAGLLADTAKVGKAMERTKRLPESPEKEHDLVTLQNQLSSLAAVIRGLQKVQKKDDDSTASTAARCIIPEPAAPANVPLINVPVVAPTAVAPTGEPAPSANMPVAEARDPTALAAEINLAYGQASTATAPVPGNNTPAVVPVKSTGLVWPEAAKSTAQDPSAIDAQMRAASISNELHRAQLIATELLLAQQRVTPTVQTSPLTSLMGPEYDSDGVEIVTEEPKLTDKGKIPFKNFAPTEGTDQTLSPCTLRMLEAITRNSQMMTGSRTYWSQQKSSEA